MDNQSNSDNRLILQLAGAFIAWVIGAGFATGQEVLQFFTSYGLLSYAAVLLNLLGFIFFGQVLLLTGYEHRGERGFNHFKYFCGEKLGAFYSWLIPVTLILIMPVLISGAGTTLFEYYGLNRYIGSFLMSAAVLYTYLSGFGRLIKIVSSIGPAIIVFAVLVGAVTAVRDIGSFHQISSGSAELAKMQAAGHWWVGSILYMSLNFLSGSTYFTALGLSAKSRRQAKYGAIFGAVALIFAIFVINTAMLLNASDIAVLEIPTLYLAKTVSRFFGAAFSVILLLGLFSSCSATMWSACSRFDMGSRRANGIFAVLVTVFVFILGLFSFSELISVFYPLVGYVGLIFIGCVIWKGLKIINRKSSAKKESHLNKKHAASIGFIGMPDDATIKNLEEELGKPIKKIQKADKTILLIGRGLFRRKIEIPSDK
jgi:uncharacterized membrane protein YkvI